jgi:hypothetical protein
MQDPGAASRTVLGDSFAVTPTPPLGLIGLSSTSARTSNTFDIATAQRSLITDSAQRLDLRVTMIPNCFSIPEVETKLVPAQVDSIKLALSRNRRGVSATFLGRGSGSVRVTGAVNGRQCSQEGQAFLVDGMSKTRLSLPIGVNKVTLLAQSTRKSIVVRGSRAGSARVAHARNCARVMKSLTK